MENMLSKLVSAGNKLELQTVERIKDELGDINKKIYQSQIYDIISDDRLEITMPMEQTKLILLPVDGEYDLVFYTSTGVYQCFGRIIDRYKSNNVYILVIELISNLRKFQRRDYYRYSCALDMRSRPLEEEEIKSVEKKVEYYLTPGLPLKRSVIVDISGGGLRFISSQRYEPDSLVYCTYDLSIKGQRKMYEIVGKVLSVKKIENRDESYEHRVQYLNMDVDDREEIIKFIFEEERKSIRKERG